MKKIIVFLSFLMLASAANEASATNCVASPGYTRVIAGVVLRNILQGNFVCASRGTDTWRECHGTITGGTTCTNSTQLWDLKLGTNPVDPSEQVGTWAVLLLNPPTTVTYNYGTGGPYTYSVWRNGTTYDFCGTNPAGNNVIGASVQSAPCP